MKIKNTGDVAGKEAVQLYIKSNESSVVRPEKELKGFEKTYLLPGEVKQVVFKLDKRAFAYYDTLIGDWNIEYGKFDILIGSSSRDIKLSKSVFVSPKTEAKHYYTLDSLCCDIIANPLGKRLLSSALGLNLDQNGEDDAADELKLLSFGELPLHSLVSFVPKEDLTRAKLCEIIDTLNENN